MDIKTENNMKIRRWVVEAPGTSNEHVRELHDRLPDQWWESPGPKTDQQVFEGSAQDLESAKKKVGSKAFSRCGFCDGPKPCLRDD
jgi:hypothetical protein